MDENTNLNNVDDTGVELVNTDNTITDADTNTEETVTLSKIDYDKAIQAAEDKVRTKLSKEIRDLKAKLPVKKTEAEIELDNRLNELENKQLEIETKEKDLLIRAALQENNIDRDIANFVKSDIDVSDFCNAIEKIVSARLATQGYVPNSHKNNTGITKEQLMSMTYSEMEKAIELNPNLINLLK